MNLASCLLALLSCSILLFSNHAQEPPVITEVVTTGTNLLLRFTAASGVQKLTLESKGQALGHVWEPRAVRRISAGGESVISIPRVEQMELLRLRADTNDILPSAFFTGRSDFPAEVVPWPVSTTGGGTGTTAGFPGGGGTTSGLTTGGTTAGGTTTGATTAGTTAGGVTAGSPGGTPPPASVVESDIWKIDGSTLYFFNQLRGLQKIDLSGQPVLKSIYPLPGVGEQMYTLPNDVVILLAKRSACDSSGGRVLAIDMSGEPKLLWEHLLPGAILESRLIGSDLFVAVSDYRNVPGQNIWESGTTIQALDVAEPSRKTLIRELYYPGTAQAVSANERFFLVSRSTQATNGWVRPPKLFDFFINSGAFAGGTFSVRLSSSTNTFEYRSPTGLWVPAGRFSWVNELELVLKFADSGTDRIRFATGAPGYFSGTYTDGADTREYTGTYSSDSQVQFRTRNGVLLVEIASIRSEDPVVGFAETAGVAPDKFKMYESDGILSVISRDNTTYLETFALNDPAKPRPLGKVSFAQFEQLYATRFAGDKAYVVTFRRTDPLWIVDLSKPENPTIMGELSVPGWSTFIEPFGDKLLTIGFGDNFGQRVAVSIFDVSNAAAPKLAARQFIGTTQSSSESTVNEKAFGFIPEAGLILVPFQEQAGLSGAQNKVQLLDFAGTNLTLRGTISHAMSARRSTVVGNTILSLSNRELLAVDASDRSKPQVKSSVELAAPVDGLLPYGEYLIELYRGSAGPTELRTTRGNQVLARYELGPNRTIYRTQVIGHFLYLMEAVANAQAGLELSIFDLDRLPDLAPLNRPGLPFPNGLYHSTELLEIAPGKVVWAASTLLIENIMPTGVPGIGMPVGIGSDYLTGRTLIFSYQPIGSERFDFVSNTSASYENGADIATYTYDPATGITTIIRSGGQLYRFTLPPGASTGPITVFYDGPEPEIDQATFTLNPPPGYVPVPQPGYSSFQDGSIRRGAPTYYLVNVADPAKPFVETNLTMHVPAGSYFSPTFSAGGKLFTSFVQNSITSLDHHGLFAIAQRPQLAVIDLAQFSEPVHRRFVDLPAPLVGISHDGSILYTAKANPTNNIERAVSALAYDGADAYFLDSRPYNLHSSFSSWGDRLHIQNDVVYVLATTNNATSLQAWQIGDTPKFKPVLDISVPSDSYDVRSISGTISVLTLDRVLVVSPETERISGELNLRSTKGACREVVPDLIVKQGETYLAPLVEFGVQVLPLEPFN